MNQHKERIRLRDKTVELQIKFEEDCRSLGINVHSDEIIKRIKFRPDLPFAPKTHMRSIVCVPRGIKLPPFDEYYKAVRDYENFIGREGRRSPMPRWINGKDIRSKRPNFDVTTITYRFNEAWSCHRVSIDSLMNEIQILINNCKDSIKSSEKLIEDILAKESRNAQDDSFVEIYRNTIKDDKKLIREERAKIRYLLSLKERGELEVVEKIPSGKAVKISATHYDSEGFRVCTQKTLNRILLIPVADNYEFKEAQRRRIHNAT